MNDCQTWRQICMAKISRLYCIEIQSTAAYNAFSIPINLAAEGTMVLLSGFKAMCVRH